MLDKSIAAAFIYATITIAISFTGLFASLAGISWLNNAMTTILFGLIPVGIVLVMVYGFAAALHVWRHPNDL